MTRVAASLARSGAVVWADKLRTEPVTGVEDTWTLKRLAERMELGMRSKRTCMRLMAVRAFSNWTNIDARRKRKRSGSFTKWLGCARF